MYDREKSEFYSVVGMALVFAVIAGGVVFGIMSLISEDIAAYIAIGAGVAIALAIIILYQCGFSDAESFAVVFVWSLGTLFVFLCVWCAFGEKHILGALLTLGLSLIWIPGACVPITKNLCAERNSRKKRDNGK